MRLRRTPSRTAAPNDTTTADRRAAWDGFAVIPDAPVVVIHARRASEIVDAQQVA